MESYRYRVSRLERLSTPSSIRQNSCGTRFDEPLPARAIRINALDTDLDMRVTPHEFGNGRLHRCLRLRGSGPQ